MSKLNKEQILKIAISLFKTKGYAATSISDIADACGILKGSIYHHFESKEAILSQSLDFLNQYFQNNVFSIAYNSKLEITNRLIKLSRKSEEQFLEGDGGCYMTWMGLELSGMHHQELLSKIQFFYQLWIDAFSHLYSFVLTDAQVVSKVIQAIAQIEGAVAMSRIMQNPKYLTTVNQALITEFKQLKQIHSNAIPVSI